MNIGERLKGINERFVREGAERIRASSLENLARRAGDVRRLLTRVGPLQKHLGDASLLLNLVQDYRSGRYPAVPWRAISSIGFALLYVLNPLDLIPDIIPLVGQLDDALVLSICLSLVDQELKRYRSWKEAGQSPPGDDPCAPGPCPAQP
jgi:uncharacterized membrane protein YkvA (DUF1232 family)